MNRENRIYLDLNVFVDMLQNRQPGLLDQVEKHKKAFAFIFSPAHLEEVAVIFRSDTDQSRAQGLVDRHCQLISKVCDDLEVLPAASEGGPSRFVHESPKTCLSRVFDHYERTLSAEDNESFVLSRKTPETLSSFASKQGLPPSFGDGVETYLDERTRTGISTDIGNVDPREIFSQAGVQQILREKLFNYQWSVNDLPKGEALLRSHSTREVVINLTMKVLEQAGYNAHAPSQIRSQIHDVSHAIYGAEASRFVTGDRRFAKRLKAVYSFLNLQTEVLDTANFVAFPTSA